MPFKLLSCCVKDGDKSSRQEKYEPIKDEETKKSVAKSGDSPTDGLPSSSTPDSKKETSNTPAAASPGSPDGRISTAATPQPVSPKVVSKSLKLQVNSVAQQLLLGEAPSNVARCTKNVRLNVYGIPGGYSSVFSNVFYSQILPAIEELCGKFDYEVELLDHTCNYDTASCVYYDKNFDYKQLVQCQTFKRGPYRQFNLIVIPTCSFDSHVLAPVFEKQDFSILTQLPLSDETKILLKENFIPVDSFYRLKPGLSLEERKEVISSVHKVLVEEGSNSLKEKYCYSTFENIVNHLFTHATDVRDTTCVLYLNNSCGEASSPSVDSNGGIGSNAKTLANTIRAQLPTSSFIEMDESTFQSTHGEAIAKVVQKIIESFCSEHERFSYVTNSLPQYLHNELLTHNRHMRTVSNYATKLKHCIALPDMDSSDIFKHQVVLIHSENNLLRNFLFARHLRDSSVETSPESCPETDNEGNASSAVKLFRFLNLTPGSFSLDSLLYSLKEQLCFMSGTHPSQTSSLDLVQLTDALIQQTDQHLIIALDGINEFDWLPSRGEIHERVHFLLSSHDPCNFDPALHNSKVLKLESSFNLEVAILKERFIGILPSNLKSEKVTIDSIVETLNEKFDESVRVALKHMSMFPLTFTQSDLRHSLSLEDKIGHSVSLEALEILLSPLVFKIYSTNSVAFCMLPCSLSERFKEPEASTTEILASFTSTSSAKILQMSLALHKSSLSLAESENCLLSVKQFPKVLGLLQHESEELKCDENTLTAFGNLLELISPSLYLKYLESQEKGSHDEDYQMFYDAVKTSSYPLSLAASATCKSAFFRFFKPKVEGGAITSESHPFCWHVYKFLSECGSVPEISTHLESESDTMRPRKMKLITWLNAEGSQDFIVVLSQNSVAGNAADTSVPRGRIDVVRVADMKVMRKIDMDKIPVEIQFIDVTNCVVNSERTLRTIDLDDGTLKVQLNSQLNVEYPCYGIQGPDQVVCMSRNKMYVNGVMLSTNTTNFSFKVGEDRFLNSLIVSPDGSYCACGDTVQKPMPLLIWDLKQQVLIHDIRIPDHEFDMKLAMVSNHYIAVVVKHIEPELLNFVNVYEFQSSYNKYNFHEDASITSLFLTPDDHHLILGLADCSIVIHHLGSSVAPITITRMHRTPVDLMQCNVNSSVFLTCSISHKFSDRTINLFTVSSGELLGTLTPETHFTCVAIAPVGFCFLYGTNESSALIKVSFSCDQHEKQLDTCKVLPSQSAQFGKEENEGKHSSIQRSKPK